LLGESERSARGIKCPLLREQGVRVVPERLQWWT
jgi:hypothetical protein